MEGDYGSEIGKKMRSAVKAKLLELGTGNSSGYIDDELPDYVMIMVANKRSKQQMINDLDLFLGDKAELFVTWLHEVLHKLNEVTLMVPAHSITSKKRKLLQKDELPQKKDKKATKKEKGKSRKIEEKPQTSAKSLSSTVEKPSVVVHKPITDVFAEDLLSKAKKTYDLNADTVSNIKKTDTEKPNFDNPITVTKPVVPEFQNTISIAPNLATTQTKPSESIAAPPAPPTNTSLEKKHATHSSEAHMKDIGVVDDDFLNLKDDGSNDELNLEHESRNNIASKQKSPIECIRKTVGKQESTIEIRQATRQLSVSLSSSPSPPKFTVNRSSTQYGNNTKDIPQVNRRSRERQRGGATESTKGENKKPVHERLGLRQHSRERLREKPRTRQDKELYIPNFRRTELDRKKESSPMFDERKERRGQWERSRSRELDKNCIRESGKRRSDFRREECLNMRKDRNRVRDRSERSRACSRALDHSNSEVAPLKLSLTNSPERKEDISVEVKRHRIGSRVIVAPLKSSEPVDGDHTLSVNSVVKIKPRPPVSPSKQACKSLLLKAVAEAQRSTILLKGKSVQDKTISRNTKLYTKSYRNRIKRGGVEDSYRNRLQGSPKSPYNGEKNAQHISRSGAGRALSKSNYIILTRDISETDGNCQKSCAANSNDETEEPICSDTRVKGDIPKTQFVVTLNDEKTPDKYKKALCFRSRSVTPETDIRSVNGNTSSKNTLPSHTHQRIQPRNMFRGIRDGNSFVKVSLSLSERESSNSSPSGSSTSQRRRSDLIEVYRKPKDVKKIIIKTDTDDDDYSPKKAYSSTQGDTDPLEKPQPPLSTAVVANKWKKDRPSDTYCRSRSRSRSRTPQRSKRTPIKFNLNEYEETPPLSHHRFNKIENNSTLERHYEESCNKISIRNSEAKKYDNIPSLNSLTMETTGTKAIKPKERCKYHPNCTKQFCDYYHPSAPCKSFPNCKYADKCIYSHPKCKYDVTCTNIDCNFSHGVARNSSLIQPTAPPLSSHVVPVQSYKSISAAAPSVSSTMCKYYPSCTKVGCPFFHPKPCRFGKNCINKLECNFYHAELQSSNKFKWVASII